MTIEKIQNSKIITFKPAGIKVQSPVTGAEFISIQTQDKAPSDPTYYQAINKINRQNHFIAYTKNNNVKLIIPFENRDSITLELSKDDLSDLLLNQNGSLDDESIDFFVELFKSFYKIRKEKYEKEKAILLSILNDNSVSKITALNSIENLNYALLKNIATPPEDYIHALLEDIYDNETRKTLAKIYLNRIEEDMAKSVITVAKEAMFILKLSKKEGFLDKSNLEEKTKLAVLTINKELESSNDGF